MPRETTDSGAPRSGLFIVVVLGVLFFALLALLFFARKDKPAAGAEAAETMYVNVPALKVRSEPSPKGAVVTTLRQGEAVQSLEESEGWLHLRSAGGVEGWSERSALERASERERRVGRVAAIRKLPTLTAKVLTSTALFAGPGPFYPIVGQLHEGEPVRVFTRDHDFYAIDHAGDVAYADIDAIDMSEAGVSARLDVAESQATVTDTDQEPPPAPAATEEGDSEPVPAREEPARAEGRVYPVVPPGGTQPVIVERTKPRYPILARRAGTEGTVILRAIIRRDGTVDDVEVLRDLPNGLGNAAQEAVEQWRFRPATLDGRPIDVYYSVTVNFRLTP